ncbi:MAG: dephospho-CoA kinase [Candidatus Zixiibacteriota bacterium]|nr:MAG: dephospho-CoA kinase [candidate division Zixibacteria bacterium]
MRIGLTGGIGSGASEAARRLEQMGIPVISADAVGHDVLLDPLVKRELAAALGNDLFDAAGEVDRAKLGARVFADPEARRILNRLVHPLLLDEVAARAREEEARSGIVVVDAALIYEWGFQGFFQKVIVVDAPMEQRIHRTMARDQLTREQVEQRLAAQWPLEKKAARADVVITNDGTLEELQRKVEEAWKVIIAPP